MHPSFFEGLLLLRLSESVEASVLLWCCLHFRSVAVGALFQTRIIRCCCHHCVLYFVASVLHCFVFSLSSCVFSSSFSSFVGLIVFPVLDICPCAFSLSDTCSRLLRYQSNKFSLTLFSFCNQNYFHTLVYQNIFSHSFLWTVRLLTD